MKSCPIKLIIPRIDRAARELSKMTLIAVIGRVGDKIHTVHGHDVHVDVEPPLELCDSKK